MKNKILFSIAALFIVAAVMLNFGSAKTIKVVDETGVAEYTNGDFFAPGIRYGKEYTADTITNAEADTLTFAAPINLLESNFLYNYVIQRTNLSGTTNVTLTLQESNSGTGTANWYTVASSGTTTATTDKVQGSLTYGRRHRLLVIGSGTQSTRYIVTTNLKQLNGK